MTLLKKLLVKVWTHTTPLPKRQTTEHMICISCCIRTSVRMEKNLDYPYDYDLRFTIYDLRFTIYDLRFTIYDLRFTIYDLLFTIYDLRFTIYDLLLLVCGRCATGIGRRKPTRGRPVIEIKPGRLTQPLWTELLLPRADLRELVVLDGVGLDSRHLVGCGEQVGRVVAGSGLARSDGSHCRVCSVAQHVCRITGSVRDT